MRRILTRWLAAGAAVFALGVAGAMANGCGGIDCTETETCPGVADATPDQRVVDVTIAPDAPDTSIQPEAQPADETSVAAEPVDMGDAEADAFDATLDAVEETEAPDSASDAELDAEVGPLPDVRVVDAADAAADAKVDACPNAGGPEDCTNGKDDNCDGLIDCMDPLCVPDAGGFLGYTCEPIPPGAGWIAPVLLYDTTVPTTSPAAPPIGCAGTYGTRVFAGHDDPNPAGSTCTCTCGLANNASCTNPTVTFYSTQSGCTGSTLGTTQVQSQCAAALPSGQGGINGIRVTDAGFPSSNGCEAGVSPNIPPFDNTNNWLRTGTGCTTAREQAGAPLFQGGCAGNQVCIENPGLTSSTHLCAVYEGAQICSGGYSVEFNYYDGGVDNRTCTASGCTCGAPPLSCNPNVTVGQGNCTTNVRNETSTTCDPVINYNAPVVAMGSATAVAGNCPASGNGTLNGGVTHNTTGVTTVCCTQ